MRLLVCRGDEGVLLLRAAVASSSLGALACTWRQHGNQRPRLAWCRTSLVLQFGVMIALGCDPVTWYRLKHMVPDIIPRGEAGWKHF